MSRPADRESFLNRLRKSSEVEITVIGRKTKKKFSAPVWFILEEDGRVLLLPSTGSNNWFKNLQNDPWIELRVDRSAIQSRATLVRDPVRGEKVFERLKTKYRSMWSESYYPKRDVYVEVQL